jgi:putative endonuclease
MTTRADTGRAAEQRAADMLSAAGLELLERNFSVRTGEIDIVARDGEEAVFIEVRARASDAYGGAAASIGVAKRRRLIRAARAWIAARRWEGPCRFDVVAVDGENLEHLRDAFRAER